MIKKHTWIKGGRELNSALRSVLDATKKEGSRTGVSGGREGESLPCVCEKKKRGGEAGKTRHLPKKNLVPPSEFTDKVKKGDERIIKRDACCRKAGEECVCMCTRVKKNTRADGPPRQARRRTQAARTTRRTRSRGSTRASRASPRGAAPPA